MANKNKKKSTYIVNIGMTFSRTFKVKAHTAKIAEEKAFVMFMEKLEKNWFTIYNEKYKS